MSGVPLVSLPEPIRLFDEPQKATVASRFAGNGRPFDAAEGRLAARSVGRRSRVPRRASRSRPRRSPHEDAGPPEDGERRAIHLRGAVDRARYACQRGPRQGAETEDGGSTPIAPVSASRRCRRSAFSPASLRGEREHVVFDGDRRETLNGGTAHALNRAPVDAARPDGVG
jgi:hypothetical protein